MLHASSMLMLLADPTFFVPFTLFLLYLLYYFCCVAKKPKVYCGEGKFRTFLLNNCSTIRNRFYPTIWCTSAVGQSFLAKFMRARVPELRFRREYLTTADGAQISLDWLVNNPSIPDILTDEKKPIAFIIPGITGHSQSDYLRKMLSDINELGYKVVVFNSRGRGGNALLNPKLYCATNDEDIKMSMAYVKVLHPNAKIVSLGLSFGGVLLSRYLINAGAESVPDAALIVCASFDITVTAKNMEKSWFNLFFNYAFTRYICNEVIQIHKHVLQLTPDINYADIMKCKHMREFDEKFTIKTWGFKSTDQYYKAGSNFDTLSQVQVPTLCINAVDDIIAPIPSLPLETAQQRKNVAIAVTNRGGHMGFIKGVFPSLMLEKLFREFFGAMLTVGDIRADLM